jgi:chromosomal replication initiation ATPase DnaA
VEILEPDDDLLRRVLVKLFADRQIDIDPAVVEFLAVRMERSVAAAQALVDRLDRASLSAGRRITRPLAAAVLAEQDPAA